MSFVQDTVKNYGTWVQRQHDERDKLMEGAKAGETADTLMLMDNQQGEGRMTSLVTNIVSKQNEFLRDPVNALKN